MSWCLPTSTITHDITFSKNLKKHIQSTNDTKPQEGDLEEFGTTNARWRSYRWPRAKTVGRYLSQAWVSSILSHVNSSYLSTKNVFKMTDTLRSMRYGGNGTDVCLHVHSARRRYRRGASMVLVWPDRYAVCVQWLHCAGSLRRCMLRRRDGNGVSPTGRRHERVAPRVAVQILSDRRRKIFTWYEICTLWYPKHISWCQMYKLWCQMYMLRCQIYTMWHNVCILWYTM